MNQELIKQAMVMFDSPEKWNAFLELVGQKDAIRNQWQTKLKEEANKKFSTDESIDGWSFKSWGNWTMKWYQTKHGEDSIAIWFEDGQISLWCDSKIFRIEDIHKKLKTEEFKPLFDSFSRIDNSFEEGYLVKEIRNFSFNSPFDTKFDVDRLSWFAGNETENFLNQIVEKVNKFRKDEKINSLLDELNSSTKISGE